jgi:hypothetical protein
MLEMDTAAIAEAVEEKEHPPRLRLARAAPARLIAYDSSISGKITCNTSKAHPFS